MLVHWQKNTHRTRRWGEKIVNDPFQSWEQATVDTAWQQYFEWLVSGKGYLSLLCSEPYPSGQLPVHHEIKSSQFVSMFLNSFRIVITSNHFFFLRLITITNQSISSNHTEIVAITVADWIYIANSNLELYKFLVFNIHFFLFYFQQQQKSAFLFSLRDGKSKKSISVDRIIRTPN